MPGVINNPAIAMYVAAAVALVVMIGFFIYLWRMDRHVRALQQQLNNEEQQSITTPVATSEPLRPQRIEKELRDGLNRG
jgi:flagellar biosynthesis/type III secretory pathway M-ring protein FliF/YscJ